MNLNPTSRDFRLDVLRGLFLVIMAAVHVPTPLSSRLHEPFGFVGAAEGFVFMGACLAGWVYGRQYQRAGWAGMSRRVWGRARLIYLIHLGLAIPMVLLAWALADQVAPLANHFHQFLLHPLGSLALMPFLLHQPPLFDILPLYVVLLGVTPLVLAAARRWSWRVVMLVSFAGWVAAQFHLGSNALHDVAEVLPVQWSSFNLFAWQFLWIGGLMLGETLSRRKIAPASRHFTVGAALAMVLFGLAVRHGFWPTAWFNPDVYLWMDKWTIGPLRMLNLVAWVWLMVAWQPRVPTSLLSPLALLGRHSLAVFALHLPLVIAASTLVQLVSFSEASLTVVGILVVMALFPWAAWLESRTRRATPVTAATVPVPQPR